jgi:hypothetical protein
MEVSVSAIALYYPWRHFQDDDWLKLALLAWDKVARVHPRGLPDNDDLMVRQLCAETDVLMDIVPSEADLDAVTGAFTDIVTSRDRELVSYFAGSAPWQDDVRYTQAWTNSATSQVALFDLYAGPEDPMISQALCELLISLDLAVPAETGAAGEQRWISVRRRLGSAYLASLADVMAQRNMLSPVTDSDRMHRAFGALDRIPEMLFSDDDPVRGLEDANSAYLHVALNAVLEPRRLADVPTTTLIKFRERYRAELIAFRQHIEGLSSELQAIAAVENLEVTRAHLEFLYERTTKPQLDELRRALRGLGIESTIGAMALKIDVNVAAGTLVGGIAAAGGQWAVAGAAAVISVIPYIAGVRKQRHEIAASPVAFLLAADRMLSGKALLQSRSGYPDKNGELSTRWVTRLRGNCI